MVGGGDGMRDEGDGAELYDPDTGTWTAIASMKSPKDYISATLLGDGTVLVMGNCCYSTIAASRAVRHGHWSLDRGWGAGHSLSHRPRCCSMARCW